MHENYFATCQFKKSKNQQFKCGDEVWFHHPEKYGMVVMPNTKGRVTEELPCNYYHVLYNTVEETECTATLYGSMMVLGRPSPTENEQCTNALSSVQSLSCKMLQRKCFFRVVIQQKSL